MTYEERLNSWGRRIASEVGVIEVPDDATFELECYVGTGCETCGPESSIDLYMQPQHGKRLLVREWSTYALTDVLKGILADA